MFNSHSDIVNPRELLRLLTIEKLQLHNYKLDSRNKVITRVLLRKDIMEHPLKSELPKIKCDGNVVVSVFSPELDAEKRDTIKDTIKLLSKNEKIILAEIKKEPKITSKELSVLLNINLRNTKNNISKLKQRGLLKRVGSTKGGHWEAKNGS